ncbi:molybdate ABC transporter substrate-binding protein [Paracoccus sp. MC1862]|uniref:molybdate ABC transporter substrate-binding protein n=1 Tax=Paracoccus sp. MC1862 TaxID=2760307 RepID=UPI00160448FE|nr:molybdate ABC transporter substrate-binding protein [Paracoccus sp. MC1862]MBB1499013.1 molybdate ABC transporter substrate-binding protein [Paracoccus sp. MC1862]QQO44649.1 molybdate ABC transporter substrate-binding protein [Paracoccus sp. MC1862]
MPRLPVALAAALLLPLSAAAAEVVVFAAASMKTALDPIAEAFQQATGDTVTISYAGSNALAQQILQGAPADIFISASTQWMDEVERAGDVAEGTRTDLLGNRLVLVAHDEAAPQLTPARGFDLVGALDGGKLAMALVDAVPAGQYGKEALTTLGVWDQVEPHVAQADNVRAALTLVATGEAPMGIVYATDAAAEPNVHVTGTFPKDSHAPITYPAALLENASDEADRAFFDALGAPEADAVFQQQGFTLLN